MGQSYEQMKEARVASKTKAIVALLGQKGSHLLSDDEEVVVVKRPRGRPPKEKALAAPPKRRGRPPKKLAEVAVVEAAPPKRRGRPPKVKAVEAEAAPPKRRGRPPKARDAVVEAAPPVAPKRRGRPPKVKAVEAEAAPPKRRGRPPKERAVAVVTAPVTTAVAVAKAAAPKKTKINTKEIAILKVLNGSGRGRFGSFKIADIAEKCFPDETPATAQAWVRASLRRPVSSSWVEFVSRGEYRMSLEGRRVLQEVTA